MNLRLVAQVGVGTGVSIACVLLILQVVDVRDVPRLLNQAPPLLLLVAVLLTALDLLLRAFRWQVLTSGFARVPVRRTAAYLMVGYLANSVLPVRLGEVVRAHLLGAREGISRTSVLGTVVVERVLDVVSLLALSTIGWWMLGTPDGLIGLLSVGLVGGFVAVGLVIAVLSAHHLPTIWRDRWVPLRVQVVSAKFRAGVAVLAAPPLAMRSLALSLAAWGVTALTFGTAAIALGVQLSAAEILVISAAANLATAIPSGPGNVGTFELAVVATATAVGIAPTPALAMGLLVHAAILLTTTAGGLGSLYAIGLHSLIRLPLSATGLAKSPATGNQPAALTTSARQMRE